jgi:hypothetical protein
MQDLAVEGVSLDDGLRVERFRIETRWYMTRPSKHLFYPLSRCISKQTEMGTARLSLSYHSVFAVELVNSIQSNISSTISKKQRHWDLREADTGPMKKTDEL